MIQFIFSVYWLLAICGFLARRAPGKTCCTFDISVRKSNTQLIYRQ